MDHDRQHDRDREERLDRLPEHERDDARSSGAGILGEGGTAVDRGTGSMGGVAQGPDAQPGPDPDPWDAVLGTDDPSARAAGTPGDPTPGISDYTEARGEPDDDRR